MNITSTPYDSLEEICFQKYTIAIVGDTHDDRSNYAHRVLNNSVNLIKKVIYLSDSNQLQIDSDIVEINAIHDYVDPRSNIIIESTSLGTAEIILLTRILTLLGCKNISYIYVEPDSYQKSRNKEVIHRRDFDITGERRNYSALPGMNFLLGKSHNVALFAGFEGERMSQALEEHEINTHQVQVVFGVPALKPGWEIDSFANNVDAMIEHGVNTQHSYCPANNPILTYKYLCNKLKKITPKTKLFIIPLGTKLQTIGISIFMSHHTEVGVMYDNPVVSSSSTEGISKCHLISFNSSDS